MYLLHYRLRLMHELKEITMLNKDIVTMYRGLTSLASDLETKLPAKVSFAIVRNIKLLTPIVEDIDFARQSVAATYGVEVDGGYSIPE
nr:MAG TPA: Protein of unknown function (DUF1617) [Caudoviricetes sp.]